MGFTPRQVDEMSIAEFIACIEGWNRSQGGGKKQPVGDMDDADLRALGVEGF